MQPPVVEPPEQPAAGSHRHRPSSPRIPPVTGGWTARATSAAGAVAVGAAAYPVPAGASSSRRRATTPGRHLVRAVARPRQGGRRSALRRHRRAPGRQVPRERHRAGRQAADDPVLPRRGVWLDGSGAVTRLGRPRRRLARGRLDREFDASPTYTRARRTARRRLGVRQPRLPDGSPPRSGLDRRCRAAAGGLARRRSSAGTFFVDTRATGCTSAPTRRARPCGPATCPKALSVRGAGSVVRGIGMRRYATVRARTWARCVVDAAGRHARERRRSPTTPPGPLRRRQRRHAQRVRNVTLDRNGMLGMDAKLRRRPGPSTVSALSATTPSTSTPRRSRAASRSPAPAADGHATASSPTTSAPGLWFDESVVQRHDHRQRDARQQPSRAVVRDLEPGR